MERRNGRDGYTAIHTDRGNTICTPTENGGSIKNTDNFFIKKCLFEVRLIYFVCMPFCTLRLCTNLLDNYHVLFSVMAIWDMSSKAKCTDSDHSMH